MFATKVDELEDTEADLVISSTLPSVVVDVVDFLHKRSIAFLSSSSQNKCNACGKCLTDNLNRYSFDPQYRGGH